MKKTLFFVCAFAFIFIPAVALGADPTAGLDGTGTGLVPQCEGAFCRACDLVTLSNNVINFGIVFSVVVATLMFAYAGILYVTAAGAGAEQVKKAHKIFVNVFVGLLVVLLAWLLVNIMVSVLTGKGLSIWAKIQCVANPTTDAFAPAGDSNVGDLGGIRGGSQIPSVSTSAICAPLTSGPCAPSNLIGYFGPDATNMSSICRLESRGRPDARSDTDILWGDKQKRKFSIGLFQINLTQNDITCGGRTYDCTSAFNPPTNPNETRQTSWGTARSGTGFGYTIKNEALYNTCVAQASNPTCNLQNAQNIYERQKISAWATSARRCNLN